MLLYFQRLNLIYCPISQAFDGEFKQAMLKAEGTKMTLRQFYRLSEQQAIHSEAQKLNLRSSVRLHPEKLDGGHHRSLVVVRNPWSRLAIAYRNSIGSMKYTSRCTKHMKAGSQVLTFKEFLECVLSHANDSFSMNKLDTTLSPIHTLCSVCRLRLTAVGKL
ncbi:hypothetical protein EB796_000059 [Bugula neritina]|uniref:Carbohydrate sulfotransferase n=1 Tax=Bugula neritina TaxID=10212 RepID=A0A7J7KTW5_BUGNE|nr:hypothetical protein EB796_000059 [Bugula neritina]